MKSKVIALVVGSLLATSGWAADKQRAPKEESIGIGTGAAIGALAGGPVGLIVGVAFGGWLGDRFHQERTARMTADERFAAADAKALSLQTQLVATERVITQKDAALTSERVARQRDLQEALELEVLFRTEESAVGSDAEERLAKLAVLVAPLDGAVIRLEGHADARGTEEFNATLSTARAEAVRDALIRAGMPAERIVISAAGEADSTAAEQDAEGMALDRRVQIAIVDLDDASRVALQSAD